MHKTDFKIKEYGYRDYGLKYWAAIRKYVRGILDIYYENDKEIFKNYLLELPIGRKLTGSWPEVDYWNFKKAIQDDVEIQNWIGEVKRYGFTYADDAEIPQGRGWL